MGESINVAVPLALLGPILTGLLGWLAGIFTDRRKRCANCPEHKDHQDKIAGVEQRQAALEATLKQLCDRVDDVHDMMLQILNRT